MPTTTTRYVTGYNYADNSPRFSDFVARGRRRGGGGAPPDDARADIGRNDFGHPSSLAVSPEAGLSFASRAFIAGYGWFVVEDRTDVGLTNAPRFDVWTAGATQAELHALTGFREITVFRTGESVSDDWRVLAAGAAWRYQEWTQPPRLAAFRNRPHWHGLYREGALLL